MGFQDIKTATNMRDTIAAIAAGVVNKMRPEERIGKVFSTGAQTAKILFPGETTSSLVDAHFAKNMIPRVLMITDFDTLEYDAPADIVRIAGKPGSYYITDYVSGDPRVENNVYVGGVWYNFTPDMPNVPMTNNYSKLMRIEDTVTVRSVVTLTAGIGNALINMPFPFASDMFIGELSVIGRVRAIDPGVAWYEGVISAQQLSGPARAGIYIPTGPGSQWSAANPVTWGSGDVWSLNYTFQAAPL